MLESSEMKPMLYIFSTLNTPFQLKIHNFDKLAHIIDSLSGTATASSITEEDSTAPLHQKLCTQVSEPRSHSSWPKTASKISSPTAVVRAGNKELKQRLNLDKSASLHQWASSALDKRADSPGEHDVVLTNPGRSVRHNRGFSFKKMADAVHLRPKTGGQTGLERTPSRRSQLLSRFFSSGRRESKDDLIRKGIYKPENVFGNHLSMLQLDEHLGVPIFLGRCVARIEGLITVEGIYRVNGDAAAVQKIRLDVDQDDFRTLDSTQDVSLLASSLKLFFRELPTPIINASLKQKLFDLKKSNNANYGEVLKKDLDELSFRVLGFLMHHLARVAAETANKMTAKNLAVVFSPNLVHAVTEARRPESIIGEMELSNVVVEDLINHCHHLFPNQLL